MGLLPTPPTAAGAPLRSGTSGEINRQAGEGEGRSRFGKNTEDDEEDMESRKGVGGADLVVRTSTAI